MTDRLRLLLVLSLLVLSFAAGAGCEKPRVYGESIVIGHVVDAETGEPIDSARVYVTSYVLPPGWGDRRHLDCYTDANGEFELWYGSDALRLFEVEKESYLPASETLKGSGELFFALEKPRAWPDVGSR
jgi:hypothetical protein